MCRQCWHLPQLEVGSRVRIVHSASLADNDEEPPAGKGQVAARVTLNPKGGREGRPLSFWKAAARILHGRYGRVEALASETGGAVSVRLDEGVADVHEGTGLQVGIGRSNPGPGLNSTRVVV